MNASNNKRPAKFLQFITALGKIIFLWLSGVVKGCFSGCLTFLVILFFGILTGIIYSIKVLDIPQTTLFVDGVFGAIMGILLAIVVGIISITISQLELFQPLKMMNRMNNFVYKYIPHIDNLVSSFENDTELSRINPVSISEQESRNSLEEYSRIQWRIRIISSCIGILISIPLVLFSKNIYVTNTIIWKITDGILLGFTLSPLASNIGLAIVHFVVFNTNNAE